MSAALFSLTSRSLAANALALQTIGHNIANANVAGYSRQTTELATAQGQFTGGGFVGKGVTVANITRAFDATRTREAMNARSLAGMDSIQRTQLDRLESLFKPGAGGLGSAVTDLFSAFSDLATNPGDSSTRAVALARAGDLAARFAATGDAIDELQTQTTEELRTRVAEVNALAQSVARVNASIAVVGNGPRPNDLMDERDRLVARMSDLVAVTTVNADDGTVSVFVGGGQRLVLGGDAGRLALTAGDADPMRLQLSLLEGGKVRKLDASNLGGGEITGLMRFQENDLVLGRNLVGRLAAAVAGSVNEQQLRGLNLQPPAGTVPSQALFGLGAPQVIPNALNATTAGSLSLAITDYAALQPSDYQWSEDATSSTGYRLTRLVDGASFEVADGSTVDGFTISFGAPGPQPGDRFLLQPVGRAAGGMTQLLNDPRDLAAAASQVGTTSPNNIGSVAVASLTVTAAPLPLPGGTTTFTFSNDNGDYTWELRDASNALVSSGSGTWQPGQPMPSPDINGFTMKLSGVPRTGDVVTVSPTPAGAIVSNNGNATALLALRDAALVGGRNPSDGYAEAMTTVGVRVQTARSASEVSRSVSQQAELARSAVSGVNLDEEAAKMIQFQQSYQAAAKMLQVAQAVFDTLLSVAGR
jgi:flagellar hook-associated protein 1 FlgK